MHDLYLYMFLLSDCNNNSKLSLPVETPHSFSCSELNSDMGIYGSFDLKTKYLTMPYHINLVSLVMVDLLLLRTIILCVLVRCFSEGDYFLFY